MNCPNCGADADFLPQSGAGTCPDTGYCDEDFLECLECGAPTSADEIERSNAEPARIAPRMAVDSEQERTEGAA